MMQGRITSRNAGMPEYSLFFDEGAALLDIVKNKKPAPEGRFFVIG